MSGKSLRQREMELTGKATHGGVYLHDSKGENRRWAQRA
jgi:hypothetical protein